jgi:hypothetical protein
MIPLRCHVQVIQTPTSSSSSVGVRQGYLCSLATSPHRSLTHSRELGSPIVHYTGLQGDDSLEIVGRRRVLERCPKLPRLPVIFADGEAQRCSRTPVLRLVVSGPRTLSAPVLQCSSPDDSTISQCRHAKTRVVVGQRCPEGRSPCSAIVGGISLDDAPNT